MYDVTQCIKTIAINIIPDISRRRGDQTMKFGQLIEYNTKNICFEKWCTKYSGKTSARPF